MARQPVVAQRAEQLLGTSVVATAPAPGSDHARGATAHKLRLSNGRTAFMKSQIPAPQGLFEREAAGLRWLREVEDGAGVPEVLAVDSDCLIIEWVETGRPNGDAAAAFGRALARTHAAGAPSYGADVDGWIGRAPMSNRPLDTWADFYRERRVTPYVKYARDRRLIDPDDAAMVERAVERAAEIVPEEPPARLHGDLWNGNVLWRNDDRVQVIDPAAYGGHREVDLAMLALFGLPQLEQVMTAYAETTPLAEGWEDRLGFHQLFPLLVHACIFNGTYGARAAKVASRYV